jgi:membrane-bound metal-dependent hydrolase YbcI (DUF457 family)
MLATVWLDIVFVPLLAAGLETIAPVPGMEPGYGRSIIHADYTHSLVGAVLLALLFGLVAAIPWGRRVGGVLGGIVFSHWVLDFVVHWHDMPILPGNAGGLPRLGLGLWQAPAVTIAVEAVLILAGAYLYWRAAAATERASSHPREGRALLVAGLIVVAGVVTLVVDVLAA